MGFFFIFFGPTLSDAGDFWLGLSDVRILPTGLVATGTGLREFWLVSLTWCIKAVD